MNITCEEVEPAIANLDIGRWLTVARETAESSDPVLPLLRFD